MRRDALHDAPFLHCVQLQKKEDAHKEAVERAVSATNHWMERFDVVVIGPGLGRDALVHDTVIQVHEGAPHHAVHLLLALQAASTHLLASGRVVIGKWLTLPGQS